MMSVNDDDLKIDKNIKRQSGLTKEKINMMQKLYSAKG